MGTVTEMNILVVTLNFVSHNNTFVLVLKMYHQFSIDFPFTFKISLTFKNMKQVLLFLRVCLPMAKGDFLWPFAIFPPELQKPWNLNGNHVFIYFSLSLFIVLLGRCFYFNIYQIISQLLLWNWEAVYAYKILGQN